MGRDAACPGDSASFGIEIGNLESWARETRALIPCEEIDCLPLVSNHTSEHEVFYRQSDDRAIKRKRRKIPPLSATRGSATLIFTHNFDLDVDVMRRQQHEFHRIGMVVKICHQR